MTDRVAVINGSGVDRTVEDDTDANESTTNGRDDETIVLGVESLVIDENLEAVMPVAKDDPYYNMNHKNRGMAVILNHEDFVEHTKLKPRVGTNKDVESLDKTLKKLGFDNHEYKNCTVEQIDDILAEVSQRDHSDSDCFVLVCLTHGSTDDCVWAYDAIYKVDKLWTSFTADKCPTLAGKPKLFFIQVCRGGQTDDGITLRHTQVDSGCAFKLSTHADFLIGFSTIPGYLSFRSSTGSYFIQVLCEVLSERGFKEDLLTLLTSVNRRVAIDFESDSPSRPEEHKKKQMPIMSFTLTRLVQFTEKSI